MCALVTLATPSPSLAGINLDLAADGSEMPYSVLNDAIPTQWSLWMLPNVMGQQIGLTVDVSATFAILSEPGLGSGIGLPVGHIVNVQHKADRAVYGVYDRLSAINCPRLLYYDWASLPIRAVEPFELAHLRTFEPGGGPIRGGGGGASGGRRAFAAPPTGGGDVITPIPEPTSLMLLAIGATALATRRRKSTC